MNPGESFISGRSFLFMKKEKALDNKLFPLYQALLVRYGDLRWWPAKTPYEVMVGAVLTQNTAWRNVEKAIANFGGSLKPEIVLEMDLSELERLIRPAGCFVRKAACLKAVTQWFGKYGCDVSAVRQEPLGKVLAELLWLKGIGQETADSILLYAFGFMTFVVDAYTLRLCGRYPIAAGTGYSSIKGFFEENILRSSEVYKNFHALIVVNAKEHCRKIPVCEGCPLGGTCKKRGL